ncbi:hypothetical protein MASR2M18_08200 [Ignavibacteria bacterium]
MRAKWLKFGILASIKVRASGQCIAPKTRTTLILDRYARHFASEIKANRPDVLFGCAAATELCMLETDIPIVGSSDSTAALNLDYNAFFSQMLDFSYRVTDEIEQIYLNKAKALYYSTERAANSAAQHYNVASDRLFVVPYGANLDDEIIPDRATVLQDKPHDVCRLLFIGVNWHYKGGSIAVETLKALLDLGIPAELTVCGCVPPEQYRHPNMHVIPFLDKNLPHDTKILAQLLLNSHFFLLPTRNEAFGIVFCEASAFGLPSISTDTGGVKEVVVSGRNGYILPYEAQGAEYANIIASIFTDCSGYNRLRSSSRDEYEMRLNWNTWGKAVASTLSNIL